MLTTFLAAISHPWFSILNNNNNNSNKNCFTTTFFHGNSTFKGMKKWDQFILANWTKSLHLISYKIKIIPGEA